MRFIALVRKELRECLPWMLLTGGVLFVYGYLVLWATLPILEYNWPRFAAYEQVNSYRLTRHPYFAAMGALLFLASMGLGLILGFRQFWLAHFTKTWGLTLHRSVSRSTILISKLTAAAIAFGVSVFLVWGAFYSYFSYGSRYAVVPAPWRYFFEGCIYVALGYIVFLGTALSGLSTARWYTTRMFGLAFAVAVIFMAVMQWRLVWAFTIIVTGIIVLLAQIIDLFLHREY